MKEPIDITKYVKDFDITGINVDDFGISDMLGLLKGETLSFTGDYQGELARAIEEEVARFEALLPNEGDTVTIEYEGVPYRVVVATRTTNADGDTVITFKHRSQP